MSAARTAPSGAVVPAAVRDADNAFVSLVEEIKALRYMPLAEFDNAAVRLALRLLNAEREAYDLAVRK